MSLNKQQAIIQTNDGLVDWHLCALLHLDELNISVAKGFYSKDKPFCHPISTDSYADRWDYWLNEAEWCIYASVNQTIIGSDNQHRCIVNWTLGNKLRWNIDGNANISFKKMHWKMSSVKWWPSFLGLNVLSDTCMCQWLVYVVSSVWHQAITWNIADVLTCIPMGTAFVEILIKILIFVQEDAIENICKILAIFPYSVF